ncbi:GntR family transcriptional regulator [Bacillus zhangzhouensis]|nr:GntR family transcriptional regulator [Bacillus zhangzhouensis]
MIFDGQFQPGERINETQLAKQFGVSRSPVREAMRLLEKDELLIADHRSGYSVYSLTEKDVEELYQIRAALETLAVELACKETSQREMEQVLTQADEAVKERSSNYMKPFTKNRECTHSLLPHLPFQRRGAPAMTEHLLHDVMHLKQVLSKTNKE